MSLLLNQRGKVEQRGFLFSYFPAEVYPQGANFGWAVPAKRDKEKRNLILSYVFQCRKNRTNKVSLYTSTSIGHNLYCESVRVLPPEPLIITVRV